MLKPMPSCTLILDVDEALATEEVRLEVKRCYAYVSSTVLRSHATPEGDTPVNTARFLVKMGSSKYLRSEDEGADELWSDVVEGWLRSTFYKVGNQMKIYNRRQRETGGVELYFDWLDVNLENNGLIVRIRLDSNSDILPETNLVITQIRRALNAGKLGAEVVLVQTPSDASYAQQFEAGMAAKAQREAEAKAQAEAEAKAQEEAAAAAVEEAADNFIESPDLVEDPEADELKAIEAELEEKFALPEADFAIDYSQWTVEYADGSRRDFDSGSDSFVDGE